MTTPTSMFSPALVVPAMRDAVRKLNPRELMRNPVMFTTACVALLLTVLLALLPAFMAMSRNIITDLRA